MDNKTLTDILSKRLDVSLDTVNSMMEGLTKIVGDSCAELDSVALPAFGTFEPRKRLERVDVAPCIRETPARSSKDCGHIQTVGNTEAKGKKWRIR